MTSAARFRPLTEVEVARIAHLLVADSSKRLKTEKGIEFSADESAIAHLLKSGGFDAMLGARPMRQTIQRLIEGPLAERILKGELVEGDTVLVQLINDTLHFTRQGGPALDASWQPEARA